MAKLIKEIEFICDRPITTSTSYISHDARVKFLKDSFDAVSAVYMEAVFSVVFSGIPNSVGSGQVQLYNETAGAAVSGSQVSGLSSGTVYFRIRSGDIKDQLTDGDVLYGQYKAGNGSSTIQLRALKLVVVQEGIISKTATYWLVGDVETRTNPAAAEVAQPKRMRLDTENYDGSVSYAYHATLKASAGTATAELYDVTNSAVRASATTSSTSYVLATATPSGLQDNAHHTTRISEDTGTVDLATAHFIIIQSGVITATESPIQVWPSEVSTSSSTYGIGEFEEAGYDPSEWAGIGTTTAYYEANLRRALSGTALSILKDDGVEISNSEVSTTSASYVRLNSSLITLPAATSDLDFDLKRSGLNAIALISSARLVITMTGITTPQINIGDVWKRLAGVQINIGDTWKTVKGMQINIGDSWKHIF